MKRPVFRLLFAAVALIPLSPARSADWLTTLPLEDGAARLARPADGTLCFLRFDSHRFAPVGSTPTAAAMPIAPFQQLWAEPVAFPGSAGDTLNLDRPPDRDKFWDQLLTVDLGAAGPLPRYRLRETGEFGAALPDAVRRIDLTSDQLDQQRRSLTDPVIPPGTTREIPWSELEAAAYPLDFQKVLLASRHDENPGFAFQNGQWFTTWLSRDLPKWTKEDHWFAPALLIGDTLIRPAPLSARTEWVRTADGATLPQWNLEWHHEEVTVRQTLFSHRAGPGGVARVFVRLELRGAPAGTRLALGAGRRPNVHYWDEPKRPRTPAPFFTLAPGYVRQERTLLDAWGHVILDSAEPFTLESLGPVEQLLVFEPDASGCVHLQTPQAEIKPAGPFTAGLFAEAAQDFSRSWREMLAAGAQVRVPSPEWQERIDLWQSQVATITRVHYQGKDRLSYGAYFYQYYFGIEEGWPVIAQALWGRGDEARRQAAIMLEPENLDKSNVHHQSRNGTAPFIAATVAQLTNDRAWLEQVAPAMRACAGWTERVRLPANDDRPPHLRGLLPPHIYGGDVRDPATSLYATTACWRGLQATAEVFRTLGSPALAEEGRALSVQTKCLRERLSEAFAAVTDRSVSPAFVPFALALPSLQGKNEGPYDALTATRYGNYWNLFAPSFLELDFRSTADAREPNASVFAFAEKHGGLWAGLPRFYAGLDAAYAIGYLGHLIDRATREPGLRPQALAGLEAFMLHAASRNGHTIPEVAGLFPYRLQRAAYEQLVRESPWNFGMYDGHRYLEGHISFTEPLGAVAGAALTLVRSALLSETRDDLGQPDGGLVLLPAVPADWLAEGKEIVLRDMPTHYGALSATIRSQLSSRRLVTVDYRFASNGRTFPRPLQFTVRLAPSGEKPQELSFTPASSGTLLAEW